MKKLIESKWSEILDILVKQYDITPVSASTFIAPLKVQSVQGDTLTFYVSNGQRGIDFIKHKFYDVYLDTVVEQVTGRHYNIVFTDSAEEKKAVGDPFESNPNLKALNPRYTFKTFVVGPTNRMAHAVAEGVAEKPGQSYNPLFLYGGPGLGKTHLMHSIAHHIITTRPDLKVLYVTSEKFTTELIDSLNHNKNQEFRDKYRTIDVLLIDDIQFIIGKESTQVEFFHTFNELYDAKKQIVISSDKHPKEFTSLEERLRSRFEWGITADIQPPDYETKMAILKNRATTARMDIPEDILQFVANNINSNIRELEGALNQIELFSRLENKPITTGLVERALRDIIDSQKQITPRYIMDIVAEHYGISVDDILSNKRSKNIAHPRQICMYLCRKYTEESLINIGKALGNRDHTTVMHGSKTIEQNLKNDEQLKSNIEMLIRKINPPA